MRKETELVAKAIQIGNVFIEKSKLDSVDRMVKLFNKSPDDPEDYSRITSATFLSNHLTINWEGPGYGTIAFYKKDGKLICDSETMSKDFIKKVLNKIVDDCELEDYSELFEDMNKRKNNNSTNANE